MAYLLHKMDLHNYQEWIAERQRLLERFKELIQFCTDVLTCQGFTQPQL
jgi:hypothetical protein